jgi:hypothetical protein
MAKRPSSNGPTRPRVQTARGKTARKRSSPAQSKAKPASGSSSRDKVRAHRKRLRTQGMRPITIWVPDTRSPGFAAEARRQCRIANKSPYAAEDQRWVDAMVGWGSD